MKPTGEVEANGRQQTQLDAVADTTAGREMDAPHEDVSPGERATGDGAEAEQGAEHAGGQIDWSRAGGGGSFEGDATTKAP
jgi:RNA polymerase sigma-54 factor